MIFEPYTALGIIVGILTLIGGGIVGYILWGLMLRPIICGVMVTIFEWVSGNYQWRYALYSGKFWWLVRHTLCRPVSATIENYWYSDFTLEHRGWFFKPPWTIRRASNRRGWFKCSNCQIQGYAFSLVTHAEGVSVCPKCGCDVTQYEV